MEQAVKEVRGQIMLYEYAFAVQMACEFARTLSGSVPEELQELNRKNKEDITREDAEKAVKVLEKLNVDGCNTSVQ